MRNVSKLFRWFYFPIDFFSQTQITLQRGIRPSLTMSINRRRLLSFQFLRICNRHYLHQQYYICMYLVHVCIFLFFIIFTSSKNNNCLLRKYKQQLNSTITAIFYFVIVINFVLGSRNYACCSEPYSVKRYV